MTKKLTVEQVATALAENASAELCENGFDYWLHIGENGEIVPFVQEAGESFSHNVPADEVPGFEEADTMDIVYQQESMETPWFREAVLDLTAQVNAWLEENTTDPQD